MKNQFVKIYANFLSANLDNFGVKMSGRRLFENFNGNSGSSRIFIFIRKYLWIILSDTCKHRSYGFSGVHILRQSS